MSWNKSKNSPLVWQKMGLGSMKTYVYFQALQRLSVNWQSGKNRNYKLTGHPSYVFCTERKRHIQECMQSFQGRTSRVSQSHIALPGRNDTDEERRPRELDQACQDTCHQTQLWRLVRHHHCSYPRAGAYVLSQKYQWLLPWTEMEWGTAIKLTSVSTHMCWAKSAFRSSPSQFPLFWLAYYRPFLVYCCTYMIHGKQDVDELMNFFTTCGRFSPDVRLLSISTMMFS